MAPAKLKVAYLNKSKQYQIVRVTDLCCYVERVIAPAQKIVFEAFADATLEIYSGEFVTALLVERIPVSSLHALIYSMHESKNK